MMISLVGITILGDFNKKLLATLIVLGFLSLLSALYGIAEIIEPKLNQRKPEASSNKEEKN